MSSLKIFLGDLPELVDRIIPYFQSDLSTLHSCILVNRLWCRTAMPLLWEDPFSTPTKNYHFIEMFLHRLNDEDKAKLSEHGISNDSFPSNTLFNYSSFVKCFNTYKFGYSVDKWAEGALTQKTEEQQPENAENEKAGEDAGSTTSRSNFDQIMDAAKLIYMSLIKLFIENEINLHTFEIVMIRDIDYEVMDLILQSPNFISEIRILKLDFSRRNNAINPKFYPFLQFIQSNCHSISSLYFNNSNNVLAIEQHMTRVINAQQNLKNICFFNNTLHNSLLSLKESNCSNTLQTIIFHKVNFKNIVNLNEVFENLNVLESVHMLYCISLNSSFVQQISSITKPFKLKSLFMGDKFQNESLESLETLLQRSGEYLENIELPLNNELKQQMLELITNYCTRIKFINLPGFDDQNIHSTFNLIKKIEENLKYLSIHFVKPYQSNDEMGKLSSIVLKELGQILPSKLEYLDLSLTIDNLEDFEAFLTNSQNTFTKRLVIENNMNVSNVDILPSIKEHVMKKKRAEYLALKFEDSEGKDLYSMKDEVKGFKSYDIKLQKYDLLKIHSYNYLKEIH